MQYTDTSALEQSSRLNVAYLQKAIPEGSFRAWLACHNDEVVASGAVLISPWPAHPYDGECRRAAILNVCTDPAYRRRGIARQLMVIIIEWCKQEASPAYLSTPAKPDDTFISHSASKPRTKCA